MSPPVAALFCMPEPGHFRLVLPLIAGLSRRGFIVYVFTDRLFAKEVERIGGLFVDLFATRSIDDVDSESLPVPCRFVTFAGRHARDAAQSLDRIRPDVVICETFAVVGRIAARLLDLPYVNVSPGHDLDPGRFLRLLNTDPRVRVSQSCGEAVEQLMELGLEDPSPFSYVTGLSRSLNICCEPPEFLTADERAVFEPAAFHGSLDSATVEPRLPGPGVYFDNETKALRLYVSLGRPVWRYYAAEASAALMTIARRVSERSDLTAVISLAGAGAEDYKRLYGCLNLRNVRVLPELDQRQALAEADAFLTHQGINSTHEAVLHGVPMISYPFFWDQPSLAERCRQLGIAVPLTPSLRSPVTADAFDLALDCMQRNREALDANLDRARTWERDVVADRATVLERIHALV